MVASVWVLASEQTNGLTPMIGDDVAEVAALFAAVFRDDRQVPLDALESYIRTVFLERPDFDPAEGSLVYRDVSGRLTAAVLMAPLQLRMHDRPIKARLMCALMKCPERGDEGAGRICLALRPKRQDFCFSDTASSRSLALTLASGGEFLPVQSLEWRRIFRPVGYMLSRRSRRVSCIGRRATALADALIRTVSNGFAVEHGRLRSRPIEPERFRWLASRMTARFALRPAWDRVEFYWLLAMASLNPALGRLEIYEVEAPSGAVIGAYLYFIGRDGLARVFHVVSLEGREGEVVGALFAQADRAGCYAAVGMAQPFLMDAMATERRLFYHHRGGFCVLSKHGDIVQALRSGDVYLGGLYSESWNRLLGDFGV